MDLVHKINSLRSRPPEQWLTAANQHLPGWSTWLLVVAIAWYLARLIWVLMPQTDEFDWTLRPPVASAPVAGGAQASSADFGAIAEAHLFGMPGAEPELVQTVDAPETRLNLKLRGTVAADDSGMAHAIIADGQGKDDVYFIKDKVPGGATLHDVQADKVILNRSGALETLKLPKLSQALGSGPRAAAARPAARLGRTASTSKASEWSGGGASFTDIMRPQPYMPNGQLKGYRIYPGRDRRKFAALGFRPGDLVTELNGQALNDLQSGMEVFKDIASASQLTVTIDRAGQPVVVTVDSSQLNSETGNTQ